MINPERPQQDDSPTKKIRLETVLIKKISPKESEGVLEKTEIHGEKFKGEQLTLETLKNNGLLPRDKTTLENLVFYFSPLYSIGHNRIGIVAYVEKDGKTVARSYYRSNSHGLWRYLPSYRMRDGVLDTYDKGYGENSITLPALIQQALAHINVDDNIVMEVDDPNIIFLGTAHHIDELATYYDEVEAQPKRLGEFFSTEEGKKINPGKIVLSPEKTPNLNPDKIIAQWKQRSETYGEIRVEILPSQDGELTYTFCRDTLNRVWIGNIEDTSELQSTGLRRSWIDGDDLTTPAFEYWGMTGGLENPELQRGDYVDMFQNYISHIPIIRAYCKSRSIELPPPRIEDAHDFETLFAILDELGGLQGENQYLNAEFLKNRITELLNGNGKSTKITRTGRLRHKVKELMSNVRKI